MTCYIVIIDVFMFVCVLC